ncbi:hypothetical protein [Consotaella aegiceratis]|uniref:hypothetical protein n=1 Tax=Consotaella aegiceratis TaxID=3097961 RepID=UPI002F4026E5
MVGELAAGIGALKGAFDIAKSIKDLNDRAAVNAAVIELQAKILEAQQAASDARDQMQEMRHLLDLYDQWDAIASRYALRDFGGDTFAYEAKQEKLNGDPPHLACPNCFRKKQLSILQFHGTYSGRRRFECQACEKHVDLGVIAERHYSKAARTPGW